MRNDPPSGNAHTEVLGLIGELCTPEDTGAILLLDAEQAPSTIQRLRDESAILGLEIGSECAYPRFRFDSDAHQVLPAVRYANQTLTSLTCSIKGRR